MSNHHHLTYDNYNQRFRVDQNNVNGSRHPSKTPRSVGRGFREQEYNNNWTKKNGIDSSQRNWWDRSTGTSTGASTSRTNICSSDSSSSSSSGNISRSRNTRSSGPSVYDGSMFHWGCRAVDYFLRRDGRIHVYAQLRIHVPGCRKTARPFLMQWVEAQRIAYWRNELPRECIARLEAIPRWTWRERPAHSRGGQVPDFGKNAASFSPEVDQSNRDSTLPGGRATSTLPQAPSRSKPVQHLARSTGLALASSSIGQSTSTLKQQSETNLTSGEDSSNDASPELATGQPKPSGVQPPKNNVTHSTEFASTSCKSDQTAPSETSATNRKSDQTSPCGTSATIRKSDQTAPSETSATNRKSEQTTPIGTSASNCIVLDSCSNAAISELVIEKHIEDIMMHLMEKGDRRTDQERRLMKTLHNHVSGLTRKMIGKCLQSSQRPEDTIEKIKDIAA